MPLENFETLLQKLGDVMGVPDLRANENGDCVLLFDDALPIHIQWEPLEDTVIFSSDIGTAPQENRAAYLEKLLSANLFWLATRGCTFALEPTSNTVVLMNRARLESLTHASFSSMLENFVASTELWKAQLAADTDAAAWSSSPSPSSTSSATPGPGRGTDADQGELASSPSPSGMLPPQGYGRLV